MSKKDKGAGARKYDRNRDWCKAYRASGTQAINEAVRAARHLARNATDPISRKIINGLSVAERRMARAKLGPAGGAKWTAAFVALGGDTKDIARAA